MPVRTPSHAPAWCALQVTPGHERALARRAARVACDSLTDSFVLYRQALRRFEGAWHLREEVMFPGYVFLVTTDRVALAEQLELLVPAARLVGAGDAVATLDDEEVAFVRDFGGARRVVEMSRGSIVDGRLVVREGPLAGREQLVAKIDRHKRIAFLNIRTGAALGGGAVRVGLEVVSKS